MHAWMDWDEWNDLYYDFEIQLNCWLDRHRAQLYCLSDADVVVAKSLALIVVSFGVLWCDFFVSIY